MSLAILVNTWNQKASLPQTMLGLSAYQGGVDKHAIQELHRVGVVKHLDTLYDDLNKIADNDDVHRQAFGAKLKEKNLIFIGDNLDKHFKNRAEKGGKRNKQLTAFNRYVTIPRAVETELNQMAVRTSEGVPATSYFHEEEDLRKMKEYMRAVIVNIAIDHLPEFEAAFEKGDLDPVVDLKMTEKTELHILPLLFHSENKYDELKEILDSDLVSPHLVMTHSLPHLSLGAGPQLAGEY